jgi:hypothetical protein
VCAPTAMRRRELLFSCVAAINREFNIVLLLVDGSVSLQAVGASIPLQPTQSWASHSDLSFQELQRKNHEQQKLRLGFPGAQRSGPVNAAPWVPFAFAPQPPNTNHIPQTRQPPNFQVGGDHTPSTSRAAVTGSYQIGYGPQSAPTYFDSAGQDERMKGPNSSSGVWPGSVVPGYANSSGVMQHIPRDDGIPDNVKSLLADLNASSGNSDAAAGGANFPSAPLLSTAPSSTTTTQHGSSSQPQLADLNASSGNSGDAAAGGANVPSPPLLHSTVSPPTSTQHGSSSQRQQSGTTYPSMRHETVALAREQLPPRLLGNDQRDDALDSGVDVDITSHDRIVACPVDDCSAEMLDQIRIRLGVAVTVCDAAKTLTLKIADATRARNISDAARHKLFDVADDELIARCGSSPQTVSLGTITPAIRRLLSQKPKRNTKQQQSAAAPEKEKPPIAIVLTEYLAATCRSALRSGETIDVLTASASGEVVYVVRGMKCRATRRRLANSILPVVVECLTNVYELGDEDSETTERGNELRQLLNGAEIGVPSGLFSTLIADHGLYIVARDLQSNDDIAKATVGGQYRSLVACCEELQLLRLQEE